MVKRSRRVALVAGLVGLVGALTLVIAGAATAEQGYDGPARQVFQDGNPTCPDGTADAGSTSIDGSQLQAGYTDGRITITRRGEVNGIDSFDWVIADHSVDVMAVIVKGGDGAYIYFYDALGGSWGDNNLAPPLNNGGQAPQISHAVFCYDPKEAPNPELKVEKSASGTSQITHSWAVDKQVKPAGSADSAYGDNTVLNLPDGASGTATISSATNFLRGVRTGHVDAVAQPLQTGRTVIVVETEIRDAEGRAVAKVTQTQAVLRS